MDYLLAQGVQASRMTIISYGEERPQCTEKNERAAPAIAGATSS